MNKQRMKEIIKQLKDITNELESEVYSDAKSYVTSPPLTDYEEIFEDDDDGYAD